MALTSLQIAIVGFGTAGQAAAVLLSRDGHSVQVFEQTSKLGPVGAGFLLQPVGLQVLWEMGLLAKAAAYGRRVERLYGETRKGRVVMDMRYMHLDPVLSGLGMQRGALFSILAEALGSEVPIHCGRRIVAVSDDGRRICTADGKSEGPFDLILCADGSASLLRNGVGKRRIDKPYPWGALWCLLAQGDWAYPRELRQRYLKARKMIGFLPVGTRPDDATARLSFFWSLPASEFDSWRARGIEPWLDEIKALWPEARAQMGAIRDVDQLSRAGYRDVIPVDWYRDRVVLLGDAAHAMSPQLGQGVNMALLDALAIRDALRMHTRINEALSQYQQLRSRHVSAYHFWSRWLTPLFQSELDLVAALRDLAFHPMGRVWGLRSLMLRVLSGTQLGAFGKFRLSDEFMLAFERLQYQESAVALLEPSAERE